MTEMCTISDVRREVAMKIKETVLASAEDFDSIIAKLKLRRYRVTKKGKPVMYLVYYVKIPIFLVRHLKYRKGDILEVAFRKITDKHVIKQWRIEKNDQN